jgi:hypothetical protein
LQPQLPPLHGFECAFTMWRIILSTSVNSIPQILQTGLISCVLFLLKSFIVTLPWDDNKSESVNWVQKPGVRILRKMFIR